MSGFHRFTCFLFSVTLFTSGGVSARDWFVNPEIGKPENDGSQGFPLSRVQDAIDRAGPGDRIKLFPAQAIYRQAVKLTEDQAGLVIEGNGVTLTGADPLPEDKWEKIGENLYRQRIVAPEKLPLRVVSANTGLLELPGNTDEYPQVEELEENQYRYDSIDEKEGWLTWKGDPEGLSVLYRPVGVSASDAARSVKIFNLGVRHFRRHGFFMQGNARGIQLFNVGAFENVRTGFRARDSSSCWIHQSRSFGNGKAVSDGDDSETYYEDCSFEGSWSTEIHITGGRHSFTRCKIKPGSESVLIAVRPAELSNSEEVPASVVLRDLSISNVSATRRSWDVGAGATVFIDLSTSSQLALLSLTKHPNALISEELYRVEPIGRLPDGQPIMTWAGGGTGAPRENGYRIIHLDKHSPKEVAAEISPDNDWFGLMSPLPTADFPPQGPAFLPENEAAHAIWRWIGLTAPNAVFLPRSPEGVALAEALRTTPPAGVGMVDVFISSSDDHGRTVTSVVTRDDEENTAKAEMLRRLDRTPRKVFEALYPHYGNSFSGSYIEALALIAKIRAEARSNARELAKVHSTSSLPKNGGAIAGTLLYAEIPTDWAEERLIKVADMGFDGEKPLKSMPFHSEMSDAVFMSGPVLARAGEATGETKYFDQCANHIRFIQDLCLREDGLYRHSPLNEAAWGRGNGFPALGLAMVLDHLPENHPDRASLELSFTGHLNALADHQDANGMWHQIIDMPDSYAEFTSTCMIAYAIARGIDTELLNASIWNPRLFAAWSGIKARIGSDGKTLYNVCEGTGKQPTLEAYYRRKAILGKDSRGGAMAILLAEELIQQFGSENR